MILESLNQNDEVESIEPMCDQPDYREWAKETIVGYRAARAVAGAELGETVAPRYWPVEVVLAFLAEPVVKPQPGEIAAELYGRRK